MGPFGFMLRVSSACGNDTLALASPATESLRPAQPSIFEETRALALQADGNLLAPGRQHMHFAVLLHHDLRVNPTFRGVVAT